MMISERVIPQNVTLIPTEAPLINERNETARNELIILFTLFLHD